MITPTKFNKALKTVSSVYHELRIAKESLAAARDLLEGWVESSTGKHRDQMLEKTARLLETLP